MNNQFILKKVRAIHRSNTGSRGVMGSRACQFVVGDFENKNKKIQTRVLAKKYGEFGKYLPASVAIGDFLHMEGALLSWDEMVMRFPARLRCDEDVWQLP